MINYTKDKIIQEVQKNGISECQEFFNKDKCEDLKKYLLIIKVLKEQKILFFIDQKENFY